MRSIGCVETVKCTGIERLSCLRTHSPTSQFMSSRAGQSMSRKADVELKKMVRDLRNLLPYLKDWNAWQRELARLERNSIKLRKHRYAKLARTLEESLSTLRTVLNEERKTHAFTVNRLMIRLDDENRPAR